MAAVLVLAALGACGGKGADADAGAADAAVEKPARRDGYIIVEDRFEKVIPLVIHEAHMDLLVSCRQMQDHMKEGGKDIPLCYDPAKRARAAVKVIRVEHRPGATVDAMHVLGDSDEGAHFMVERTGTTFQLIDLAYATRRDGQNRGDEIRILAMGGKEARGAEAAAQPLLTELRALYPTARVEEVDVPGGTP
ncbi:MAG: hypothetical protein U1F43_08545 [Myxococcota bacterium]